MAGVYELQHSIQVHKDLEPDRNSAASDYTDNPFRKLALNQ